jgi:hypothetical protein
MESSFFLTYLPFLPSFPHKYIQQRHKSVTEGIKEVKKIDMSKENMELDYLVDKYIISEGGKMDAVITFLSRNLDKGISVMDTSIQTMRLHRTKNITDKGEQILRYQQQAHSLKETFIRIMYRINELKKYMEEEEKEVI